MGKPDRPLDPRIYRSFRLYRDFSSGIIDQWMTELPNRRCAGADSLVVKVPNILLNLSMFATSYAAKIEQLEESINGKGTTVRRINLIELYTTTTRTHTSGTTWRYRSVMPESLPRTGSGCRQVRQNRCRT